VVEDFYLAIEKTASYRRFIVVEKVEKADVYFLCFEHKNTKLKTKHRINKKIVKIWIEKHKQGVKYV